MEDSPKAHSPSLEESSINGKLVLYSAVGSEFGTDECMILDIEKEVTPSLFIELAPQKLFVYS